MAIKELAFSAKQHLNSVTGQQFKQSHVYELLAACNGFKSSAALHSHHVFATLDYEPDISTESLLLLNQRLIELGYADVAEVAGSAILHLVSQHRFAAVSLSFVLASVKGGHIGKRYLDDYDDDPGDSDDEFDFVANRRKEPWLDEDRLGLLFDGLDAAAGRGNALAHYVLALIYGRGGILDEHNPSPGDDYWLKQWQLGKELKGVELEWAQAALADRERISKSDFHLEQAALLGFDEATVDLAEKTGDPALLSRAFALSSFNDPMRIADLAAECGQPAMSKHWCIQAAKQGDLQAMRHLIDHIDSENIFQGWVWVFLSEMLGRDLRNSSMRAYHDGGMYADQEYDDDQGGPLYVDGDEGVELEPISSADEAEAKKLAAELFRNIGAKDAFGMMDSTTGSFV
ncbi:hypothetical protein [Stutzerimonas kunmingensis]|uniref:hypothetical protein n=1 Tax=Stutzerimonas kunmingensis TaxID=1211807 RepID=UPI0028B05735|nr:hypothetical protein [Stutzerimonas kunmingensis]